MAKDIYHQIVRAALEDEGWTVTDDPFILNFADTRFDVDLGAEILIAAEQKNRKILVEVKSFIGQSVTYDFHTAVGQFGHHLLAIEALKETRELFLAVPGVIFEDYFQKPFFQASIQRNQLKIIVFEPTSKKIVQWIK